MMSLPAMTSRDRFYVSRKDGTGGGGWVHPLILVCLFFIMVWLAPTPTDIDGFHSIFHHGNWRAKVSCDVDINQSAGSMVM